MDIKDILQGRRVFASYFQKHIKMVLDHNHSLYHEIAHSQYKLVKNHFDNFNIQDQLLKDQYLSIESQLRDIINTINQISNTSINSIEFEAIKNSLIRKKKLIKERIEKQSLKHFSYSYSLLSQFEDKLYQVVNNEKTYSTELKHSIQQLENGFPILLNFCYEWEAENLFFAKQITQDTRNLLGYVQKALRNIHKLKSLPFPFYETKEYKSLSETFPLISKSIDQITTNDKLWNFIKENSNEFPRLIGFISIFEKRDFKSIRSKIRIFSTLEKSEEMIKIIKNEFRAVEQIFSVYLYQLEAQKKEILNICLPTADYKKYLVKQWIKREFANEINELKSIEEEYQKKLLKF